MKFRTAVVVAAAGILAGGALLTPKESEECRVTSHTVVEDGGAEKVIGMSNCEAGSVLLVLDGVPFDMPVENNLFAAWIEYEGEKPVSVRNAR